MRLSTDDAPAEAVVAAEATRRFVRRCAPTSTSRLPRRGRSSATWRGPGGVAAYQCVVALHPETLTGRAEKDRVVYLALSDEDMENLLAHGVPALQSTGIDIQVPRGWSTLRPAVKVRVAPVGQEILHVLVAESEVDHPVLRPSR